MNSSRGVGDEPETADIGRELVVHRRRERASDLNDGRLVLIERQRNHAASSRGVNGGQAAERCVDRRPVRIDRRGPRVDVIAVGGLF